MVSPEVTHDGKSANPTDWRPRSGEDSVRITAEIRRQVLREHYTERLAQQRALVKSEGVDRKALGPQELVFSSADLRYSNKVAVQQDLAACVAAYTDNRDFGFTAVAK